MFSLQVPRGLLATSGCSSTAQHPEQAHPPSVSCCTWLGPELIPRPGERKVSFSHGICPFWSLTEGYPGATSPDEVDREFSESEGCCQLFSFPSGPVSKKDAEFQEIKHSDEKAYATPFGVWRVESSSCRWLSQWPFHMELNLWRVQDPFKNIFNDLPSWWKETHFFMF